MFACGRVSSFRESMEGVGGGSVKDGGECRVEPPFLQENDVRLGLNRKNCERGT